MSTKKNKVSNLDNKISSDCTQLDDKTINHKEDKNSDKYKIALKLINKILVNLDKDMVDDLTKFVNIDRDCIIKDINKKSLEEMDKEIFALFNKKNCGYYRKTDSLVLNCLRGMMKEIGFELSYEKKEKSEYINNKSFRRKHVFYSIK